LANIAFLNVYKLNSLDPYPLGQVTAIGFPTQGCLIRNIPSTLALLSTGVYVYSAIQYQNAQYYVVETQAAIVTAFG